MDLETLELLEFNSFLEMIQGYTQSPLGASRVSELSPLSDLDKIHKRQGLLRDATRYTDEAGKPSFGHLIDPGDLLANLSDPNSVLIPADLLAVLDFLQFAASAKARIGIPKYPFLSDTLAPLQIPRVLLERIKGSISSKGEIRESAHPELKSVRKSQVRWNKQIHELLERLLKGPKAKFLISDPFITQRSGRFVIPVRVESQREIPGIIHGTSSSGATVFMEPMKAVELNNQLTYYQEREAAIIREILKQLSSEAREHLDSIRGIVDSVGLLDVLFACAEYSSRYHCTEPEVAEARHLFLSNARHPLLIKTLGEESVVPISVELSEEASSMVISGPNTGGKTAALKTVGLLCAIAHSGLPLPASAAQVPLLRTLLADIGDHQSITQQLSTFSSHMIRIRDIIERAKAPALLLLDEVGRGTDPVYGASLAIAIIDHFSREKAFVISTTHHRAVKTFAASSPHIRNASVRLDPETHLPTYTIEFGVAGSSSGIEIARQLGIPDPILEHAADQLDEKEHQVERYLEELRLELKLLKERQESLDREIRALDDKRKRLDTDFSKREAQRSQEFEQTLRVLGEEFRSLGSRYLKRIKDKFEAAETKKQLQLREASLKEAFRRRMSSKNRTQEHSHEPPLQLAEGDKIYHTFFKKKGTILRISGQEAQVEIDGKKVSAQISLLTKLETRSVIRRPARQITVQVVESTDPELNLIGKTVEEAVAAADKFLDRAFLSQLPEVRIIHGFGKGRLKKAISKLLDGHAHVASFEVEGGSTRVTLRN